MPTEFIRQLANNGRVLMSLFQASDAVGGYITKSVTDLLITFSAAGHRSRLNCFVTKACV